MKNIIVVDMQKGFMCDGNKHLIKTIGDYLNENKFDNIFFTQCINNSQSPYAHILKWNEMSSSEEQKIVINIPKNSKILTKNCYGISQKDIDYIKSLGIEEMEICGTDIDACCLAIGFNLFDNNIKPVFVKDLCATSSRNQNLKEYALTIITRQFGKDSII